MKKLCFSRPSDCDPALSAGCYFLSAMMDSSSDTAVHFELTGPSDGYVSFGFSDDQIMVAAAKDANTQTSSRLLWFTSFLSVVRETMTSMCAVWAVMVW